MRGGGEGLAVGSREHGRLVPHGGHGTDEFASDDNGGCWIWNSSSGGKQGRMKRECVAGAEAAREHGLELRLVERLR